MRQSRQHPHPLQTQPNRLPTTFFDGVEVVKTEAEWKQLLTPAQYNILREAGTERPFSGEYAETHEDGDYYCAGLSSQAVQLKNQV